MQLLDCPNEILLLIAEFLDAKDLSFFLRTNSSFKHLLTPVIHRLAVQDHCGETAVHWAVSRGHLSLVTLLFERSIKFDLRDTYDYTALHLAAVNGKNEAVLLFLLDHGAEVDARDIYGMTPLFRAITESNETAATILLDRGANPNILGRDIPNGLKLMYRSLPSEADLIFNLERQTTLNIAICRLPGLVRLLIERGAYIIPCARTTYTALQYAVRFGHEEIARCLLENGADTTINYYRGTSGPALHYAVKEKNEAMTSLLLEYGASTGFMPIWTANTIPGNSRVMGLLLGKLLEIDGDKNWRKRAGGPPALTWAGYFGNNDIIKFMLSHGFDINSRNIRRSSKTALHFAAQRGQEATVRMLLDLGADPTMKDEKGRTPLMRAAKNSHENVVKLLQDRGGVLDKGVIVNTKDPATAEGIV